MEIQNTIFVKREWRWSIFLNYLIDQLGLYNCSKYFIPKEFLHNESLYGSKKARKNVNLHTWGVFNERINFARAVCINSPNYDVLNFLIIPNTNYNVPFFGVDFVSLPSCHLLVLDFQPSLDINKQFNKNLLEKIIGMRNTCHKTIPCAEAMSDEVSRFFSPGLIWSKLSRDSSNDILISKQLFDSFKEYLNLYLELLFESKAINQSVKLEIEKGQKNYLDYRKNNDPARPMLSTLFGKDFTESFINKLLFKPK